MKKKWLFPITLLFSLILLGLGAYYQLSRLIPQLPDLSGAYVRAVVREISGDRIQTVDMDLTDEYLYFKAEIQGGTYAGQTVNGVQNVSSFSVSNAKRVEVGDKVILSIPDSEGRWFFAEYVRSDYLLFLAGAFLLVLILFGRSKGVKTALSLMLTIAAVFLVFVPAVLSNDRIFLWTFLLTVYIVLFTLLIVNGYTILSFSSILGCLCGTGLATFLIILSKNVLQLTGYLDESSLYLFYLDVDLSGTLYAAMVISAIGAIMDVSVNISASLHELAVKLKCPSYKELFRSGLTIGRDILGTMSNTLILAYVGSSMCTILLVIFYNATSPLLMFNRELIVYELLQILIGSLALLLTIPASVAIASFLFTRKRFRDRVKIESQSQDPENQYTEQLRLMAESEVPHEF